MLLSLTDALRRPGRAERRAVAGAVRSVADLLEAAGDAWTERRHQVTEAMDAAYDTVIIRRLFPPRPGSTTARLAGRLDSLVGTIAYADATITRLTSLAATGHHGTPAATQEMARDLSAELRRRAARLREHRLRRVRSPR
ncbi:hypothetical protein [Streptomyces sp. NBC_00454]|uniref:hypothetical protein n=1 Tax=Streptomyces sp. NBC_00454 TaxID=2975747 RepID=UPI0030E29256